MNSAFCSGDIFPRERLCEQASFLSCFGIFVYKTLRSDDHFLTWLSSSCKPTSLEWDGGKLASPSESRRHTSVLHRHFTVWRIRCRCPTLIATSQLWPRLQRSAL